MDGGGASGRESSLDRAEICATSSCFVADRACEHRRAPASEKPPASRAGLSHGLHFHLLPSPKHVPKRIADG